MTQSSCLTVIVAVSSTASVATAVAQTQTPTQAGAGRRHRQVDDDARDRRVHGDADARAEAGRREDDRHLHRPLRRRVRSKGTLKDRALEFAFTMNAEGTDVAMQFSGEVAPDGAVDEGQGRRSPSSATRPGSAKRSQELGRSQFTSTQLARRSIAAARPDGGAQPAPVVARDRALPEAAFDDLTAVRNVAERQRRLCFARVALEHVASAGGSTLKITTSIGRPIASTEPRDRVAGRESGHAPSFGQQIRDVDDRAVAPRPAPRGSRPREKSAAGS